MTLEEENKDSEDSDAAYEAAKQLVFQEERFIPFREMFTHEPLFQFIYHEKCLFSGPFIEDRVVYNPTTQKYTGYKVNTTMPLDEYSPSRFMPFELIAVWLPLVTGKMFTTLSNSELHHCPLIKRQDNGEDTILFLIHPKSVTLYHDLLEKHADSLIRISALSLSSVRSLLIALPDSSNPGQFEPLLVKLSLDQKTQAVSRVLFERECALSIANSSAFQQKLNASAGTIPLEIIKDTWAYVPEGYPCGMLHRELPDYLNPKRDNHNGAYLIPLLSLYGVKNKALLPLLVQANGGSLTQFLINCILKPFTKIFIDLLCQHNLSIEAHGQNLLLKLDKDRRVLNLVYRDMGGVNLLLNTQELQELPENLRDKSIYYFSNHILDAANALEHHFVRRGLFPLTKQCVKNLDFKEDDSNFRDWITYMSDNNYMKNWTKGNPQDDEHETLVLTSEFYRYGFVEFLFASCLKDYLANSPWIEASELDRFNSKEKLPDGSTVAPCSYKAFFSSVITQILETKKIQAGTVLALNVNAALSDGTHLNRVDAAEAIALDTESLEVLAQDLHHEQLPAQRRISFFCHLLEYLMQAIRSLLSHVVSVFSSCCGFFSRLRTPEENLGDPCLQRNLS